MSKKTHSQLLRTSMESVDDRVFEVSHCALIGYALAMTLPIQNRTLYYSDAKATTMLPQDEEVLERIIRSISVYTTLEQDSFGKIREICDEFLSWRVAVACGTVNTSVALATDDVTLRITGINEYVSADNLVLLSGISIGNASQYKAIMDVIKLEIGIVFGTEEENE